jgi:hypothetical protein
MVKAVTIPTVRYYNLAKEVQPRGKRICRLEYHGKRSWNYKTEPTPSPTRPVFFLRSGSENLAGLLWLRLLLLLLQSALQPLVGFRTTQLSLSILSRRVLQSAVASGTSNPPTCRTRDLERSNFRHKRLLASEATLADSAAEGGTMGEKWLRILPKVATSTSLLGSFTCRKARHGTGGFTSPPKESVLRIFSPEKSDCFGRVWTRELGYQRPARYL